MPPRFPTEQGTLRKKWTGRLPLALLYPNVYATAASNLGFQLVYEQANQPDFTVCERFVMPAAGQPLRSIESNHPLTDFPVLLVALSFEQDYPGFVQLLKQGQIPPLSRDRADRPQPGDPLIILGGVAMFMNPEPVAEFADLIIIGEIEPILPTLLEELETALAAGSSREELIIHLASTLPGCYAPALYTFHYHASGQVVKIDHHHQAPARIQRLIHQTPQKAAHSTLLSDAAELPMFMVEMSRGCSRGCRFCAAGFIYRPPRRHTTNAILESIASKPDTMNRVGLIGMETMDSTTLSTVGEHLASQGCSLSFSSLRADGLHAPLPQLLADSQLKSAAIAPDGCSQRLRRIINKGLEEEALLAGAHTLVKAGIVQLKLYVMIGLPTETRDDLDEFIALMDKLRTTLLPLGQQRKQITRFTLSINSLVPKPWTPFQYLPFGGQLTTTPGVYDEMGSQAITSLKKKIKYLRQGLKGHPNLRLHVDRPEVALQQAIWSRGDRRLTPVLLAMAAGQRPFKQQLRAHGLNAYQYAIRSRSPEELFPWDLLDQGMKKGYLWQEYQKGLAEKSSVPCDPSRCQRCGICHGQPKPA